MDVCLVHGHEMKYDMRSGFDLCAECELEAFRKNHALWMDIAAFEKWQQTPDENDNFEATHVALLLSRGNHAVQS